MKKEALLPSLQARLGRWNAQENGVPGQRNAAVCFSLLTADYIFVGSTRKAFVKVVNRSMRAGTPREKRPEEVKNRGKQTNSIIAMHKNTNWWENMGNCTCMTFHQQGQTRYQMDADTSEKNDSCWKQYAVAIPQTFCFLQGCCLCKKKIEGRQWHAASNISHPRQVGKYMASVCTGDGDLYCKTVQTVVGPIQQSPLQMSRYIDYFNRDLEIQLDPTFFWNFCLYRLDFLKKHPKSSKI